MDSKNEDQQLNQEEAQEGNQDITQEEGEAELREIMAKAKQGDASAFPGLRFYLKRNEHLWRRCGDMAVQSQEAMIRLITGKDKYLQECLGYQVNSMKTEMTNEKTSTLEWLLVERVISTWLQVNYLEAQDAQQSEKSLRWAQFHLKKLNAAHQRHLKSIATLATLKKLMPSQAPEPPPAEQTITVPAGDPDSVEPAEQAQETPPTPKNGQKVPSQQEGLNRIAALLDANFMQTND
ncbi:MAG: hypothetical protein COA78_09095 [Blastopirellula sp.]|nr:MAG: hypothetical protein COA78_09095 [Blastopirellula sp.]